MRNPNGYGSVVRLSGKRRRPFWVRKTVGWNEKGHPVYQTVGYAATREEGNILLARFNRDPWDPERTKMTLGEVYILWLEKKSPRLGKSNLSSLKMAYAHIRCLSGMKYRQIKAYHMQDTIDSCARGYSTQAAIKNLWAHLDRFALELDIISKMYSGLLVSDPVPITSRNRFTDEEIRRVWEMYRQRNMPYNRRKENGANTERPEEQKQSERMEREEGWQYLDTVLIFLYTGFRISELLSLKNEDVDLSAGTLRGGGKTAAGRNRIVPIHPDVFPLIRARWNPTAEYLISAKGKSLSPSTYRRYWKDMMRALGIRKTPHECRHTFESVLDSAGANRKCIDLMMGHASRDVGNRVYNHKTLAELKEAITLYPDYFSSK